MALGHDDGVSVASESTVFAKRKGGASVWSSVRAHAHGCGCVCAARLAAVCAEHGS